MNMTRRNCRSLGVRFRELRPRPEDAGRRLWADMLNAVTPFVPEAAIREFRECAGWESSIDRKDAPRSPAIEPGGDMRHGVSEGAHCVLDYVDGTRGGQPVTWTERLRLGEERAGLARSGDLESREACAIAAAGQLVLAIEDIRVELGKAR